MIEYCISYHTLIVKDKARRAKQKMTSSPISPTQNAKLEELEVALEILRYVAWIRNISKYQTHTVPVLQVTNCEREWRCDQLKLVKTMICNHMTDEILNG